MAAIYPVAINNADLNFMKLYDLNRTKADSIQFLQNNGILSIGRTCPNGHPMPLSLTDSHDRFRCRRRTCRIAYGLRMDTFLEDSKLPFEKVVPFIYSWAYEMSSIKFCERELGIDHSTVVDWNNYLREICAQVLLQNPAQIGGPGMVVEIDESLFSRRKNHRGQVYPQQWVFGGYCRATKHCFLYAVPDRSANTLMPIIQQAILPGTLIMSDQWRAYNQIQQVPGYQHQTVNHSLNFVDPITGAHTQGVESTWRNAKMRNKRHFETHRRLLDSYLCEFMWRSRVERNGLNPFDQILRDIVQFWPAPV